MIYTLRCRQQHSKRPQEWGPLQCKYYGSVKQNDSAALIFAAFDCDIIWDSGAQDDIKSLLSFFQRSTSRFLYK